MIDALAIRHGLRQIASSYDPVDAVDEAREFLATHPYVPAREAADDADHTHAGWR